MVRIDRRWIALSSSEQRIWDDIERFYAAAEAAEPVLPGPKPARRGRPDARGGDDLPAAVVAGVWGAILLVLFGAVDVSLAIGAATALGRLLLWRS
jgi:hypothetical protein